MTATMAATVASLLAGGVGLVIQGVGLACLGRLARGRSIVVIHAAAFALGLAGLVAYAVLTPAVVRFWLAASVMVGGAAVLFFVNATLAKSISVGMARLLAAERDGALRIGDLTGAFAGRLVGGRVEVLLGMGLVERVGADGYRITGRGQIAARRLDAARRVFGVREFILYGDCPRPRPPTDPPSAARRSGPKRRNRAS